MKVNISKYFWSLNERAILEESAGKSKKPEGKPSSFSIKIGSLIREARVAGGLSQKEYYYCNSCTLIPHIKY